MAFSINYIYRCLVFVFLNLLSENILVMAEYCVGYGHSCVLPQKCCKTTCCVDDSYYHNHNMYRWSFWNMWYFWFIVIFILMSCFGGCGYWRRRQWMISQQQMASTSFATQHLSRPPHHSAITVPIYPGYTTQNGFYPTQEIVSQPQGNFPSPPPYQEVISKPETYPVNKDELPPYPGIDENNTGGVQNYGADMGHSNMSVDSSNVRSVPGLPPYSAFNVHTSAAANHNVEATSAAAYPHQGHMTNPSNQVHANGNAVAPTETSSTAVPFTSNQISAMPSVQNGVSG